MNFRVRFQKIKNLNYKIKNKKNYKVLIIKISKLNQKHFISIKIKKN